MKTILLVEDEAIVALSEAKSIKDFGYKVVVANSGEKAIKLFDDEIDLVLMDVDLGKGIDGVETTKQILEKRTVPIVFLTSHSEREIVEKVRGITRYGYVIKNSGDFVIRAAIDTAFELFESYQSIQESKSKYESLFTLMLEGFALHEIICDANGKPIDYRFLDLNPAFERLTGLKKENAVRKTILELMPNTESYWIEKYGNVALTGESISFVNYSSTLKRHYQVVAFCPRKNQFATVFSDITEQKMIEEKLQVSETMHKKMVSNASDVIAIMGADGFMKYKSPNIEKWFGWLPEDLVGTDGWDTVHPDDLERIKKEFYTLLEKDNSMKTVEYRNKCKDGSYKLIELTAMNLVNDSAINGILMNYRDVTERKQAENELRESETKWRSLVSTLPDYISLIDNEDRFVFLNHYEEGFTEKDIIGTKVYEYFSEESKESFKKEIIECQKSLSVRKFEHTAMGEHGVMREYEDYLVPVFEDKLKMVVSRDITERKNAEIKIKSLLAEKELLLKEVHHRIKNNMNTLRSIISLQIGTLQDASAISALNDAKSRLQSMAVLYDKLYESDNIRKISIKDYLTSLTDEIVANFPHKTNIKIDKKIDDFILDAKKLQSIGIIVNELLTNIMKYAFVGRSDGVITVTASKNNKVMLTIEDDGIGIPDSISFESSSGFGLLLIDALTKQLNGSIKIERGNGTKFILEIDVI